MEAEGEEEGEEEEGEEGEDAVEGEAEGVVDPEGEEAVDSKNLELREVAVDSDREDVEEEGLGAEGGSEGDNEWKYAIEYRMGLKFENCKIKKCIDSVTV